MKAQRPPDAALVAASALALGAKTQSQGGWAWPEALRAELGLGPEAAGPEAEGPLALALEAFWQRGRARRSAAALPSLHPEPSPPALARHQAVHGLQRHPSPRWVWALAFALTWACDDAGGALLWVGVGPQGEAEALAQVPGAWPEAEAPPLPPPGASAPTWAAWGVARLAELEALPEGPEPPPLARLAAEAVAKDWAEAQLEGPAMAAQSRYHAAAARVVEAASGQPMAPGPKAEAAAERLRAERARRLGELARRHALRGQLALVGQLSLRRPGWDVAQLLQGPEGQPARWQGWWDAHAGRWEGLGCAGCGAVAGPFAAAGGQVACPSCVRHCGSCQAVGLSLGRCEACQEALCAACQRLAPGLGAHCPACAPTCPRCGVAAPVGAHRCPFG